MSEMTQWFDPEFIRATVHGATQWALATAPRLLLILLVAYIAKKILNLFLNRLQHSLVSREADGDAGSEHGKRISTMMMILRRVGTVTLSVLVVMLLLTEVGIEIGPIIAGAGVIGLAVGFGAQELVRDVISGFFNLVENHIRVGDVAVVNGTGGLVEHIGLRTTILRDLQGVVHVFQNGKIDTIANMTKGWSAMVFDMGVAYREDVDTVIATMKEVAEALQQDEELGPEILEPMEVFGVDAFGDSAVVVKARLKTRPGKQWSVGREYNRRIKYAFDRKGIEIPFPHRTLFLAPDSAPLRLTDGPG